MAVSAEAAANALIRLAMKEERLLTNMEVQKHVFLAQGFCLALLDRPLYFNSTHAWQWGPVVPKLYKALQKYGSGKVVEEIPATDTLDPDSEEHKILEAVWKAYRKYTAMQLSEITHRPGTPWSKTWETAKFGVISTELMKSYFESLATART